MTITIQTRRGAFICGEYSGQRVWTTDADLCVRNLYTGQVVTFPLAQVTRFEVKDL